MKKLLFVLLALVLSVGVLCACNDIDTDQPGPGNDGEQNNDDTNSDGTNNDGANDGGENNGDQNEDTTPAYYTEGLYYLTIRNGAACIVSGQGDATDTDVVIPATYEGKPVVAIGGSAFSHYAGLKSVTVPASVTEIRANAFSDCATIESVIFEEGSTLQSIGECAFYYCTALKKIELPDTVKSIGESAFYSCTNLTDFVIGEGSVLESIGQSAFSDCRSLKNMTIPASVAEISPSAFAKCAALKSVTLSEGKLTTIGISAFAHCAELADIVIPNGVKMIDNQAFLCSGIKSVSIPSTVNTITGNPFAECENLGSITVAEGNQIYKSAGNCLIKKSSKVLIAGCKNSVIPLDEGITSIEANAFKSCTGLKSVTLPASLSKIQEYAFYNCTSLATVRFEEDCALFSIGNYAFERCNALTELMLPAKLENLGGYAFQHCKNLKTVLFEEGSEMRNFGGYAFYKCENLTLVMIPANTKSIGKDTFASCGIKAVYLSSFTVNGMLTEKSACSELARYALTIAVDESIETPSAFITKEYPYKQTITYQGTTYTLYSKHDHGNSIWTAYTHEGYQGQKCTYCQIIKDTVS